MVAAAVGVVVATGTWAVAVIFVRSLSIEGQLLVAAGGLGLFAFGVAAGLLTAVAGLIRRL